MGIPLAHEPDIGPENVWEKTRFVMLGTVHGEPSEGDALAQWLKVLAPDVITLELSEYGLRYRQTQAATRLRQLDSMMAEMKALGEPIGKPAVEMLRSYIDLPYEYAAVSTYVEERGLLLYLVDLDEPSRLKLECLDELLSRDNLIRWFREYDRNLNQERKEWVLARLFFDRGVKAFSYTDEMLLRDRHIKEKVSSLMAEHENKRFVHVCGWQHLADPQGTYAVFNPVKIFAHARGGPCS